MTHKCKESGRKVRIIKNSKVLCEVIAEDNEVFWIAPHMLEPLN